MDGLTTDSNGHLMPSNMPEHLSSNVLNLKTKIKKDKTKIDSARTINSKDSKIEPTNLF